MLDFDFSDKLKHNILKLEKRNKELIAILKSKVMQIANSDLNTIDHYKNLRYDLKDTKRVHIDKSFVLIFKVFKKENFILFDRLEHHDIVYKKKK